MPCLRGLDISISVKPQSERLPEFPHPDASSVRISLSNSGSLVDSKRASISTIDSGRLQKANPRTSVYIPSIAGSQFVVKYSVLRAPEPSCQLFFKLSINGRHVTSWGIDPIHKPVGTVSRALYEPSERWHYNEGSATLKAEGIEARSLFFSTSSSGASVADDGGLIEVHVHRAQGKRRRAVRLEQFRNQNHYGILSPSNGLLEYPETMAFFDWELIDSKATPFATFQFHYRTWNILQQLNLIPAEATTIAESYPLSHAWQRPSSSQHGIELHQGGSTLASSICRPSPLVIPSEPAEVLPADRQSLGFAIARKPVPQKSIESLSTSKAPSVAPSLLSYVEDISDDESSAEFGTAVGIQLQGVERNTMVGQRPLPEIPRRETSQINSEISDVPYHEGLSSLEIDSSTSDGPYHDGLSPTGVGSEAFDGPYHDGLSPPIPLAERKLSIHGELPGQADSRHEEHCSVGAIESEVPVDGCRCGGVGDDDGSFF